MSARQLRRTLLKTAAAAAFLGASAAVGAFLVGIAIPGTLAERARDILGPQRDLFAAIFFVSFGLGTNPRDLLAYLPVAAVLALVGVLSKVATGWYAAGRDGVQKRGRLRAGLTLAPRGEFSIVIAGLAVMAGYREVGLIATALFMGMCWTLGTTSAPVRLRYVAAVRAHEKAQRTVQEALNHVTLVRHRLQLVDEDHDATAEIYVYEVDHVLPAQGQEMEERYLGSMVNLAGTPEYTDAAKSWATERASQLEDEAGAA